MIKGQLFLCESNRGHNRPISCRTMAHSRYACVNPVFQHRSFQSTVHSTFVWVHFAGGVHKFAVFCANHQYLPLNHSIPGGHIWRGDVLVMRCGNNPEKTFVNLRSSDNYIIDRMLRRCVRHSLLILGGSATKFLSDFLWLLAKSHHSRFQQTSFSRSSARSDE